MKTLFLYNPCGRESLHFFVLDGDYRHLHDVYINGLADDDKQEELNNIISDDNLEFLYAPTKDWDYFVIVGYF